MGNRGVVCFHGKTRDQTVTPKRLRSLPNSLGRLSKTREDVKTFFEFGELDDYVSFGGKA